MSVNTIDLQVHSNFSDGKYTPREVVAMAKEKGVRVISLTDHDTVVGLPEALAAGKEFGVKVIPGIEISAEEHGIHILGYGVDYKNAELLLAFEEAKQSRLAGARKMVENLKKSGFVVEWEDVLQEAAGAALVVRPHIARAVLNRPENKEKLKGISSSGDFIETHLSDASPNYVKRAHIGAEAAIKLINRVGGVAVWSHPLLPDFHPVRSQMPQASAVPPLAEQTSNGVKEGEERPEELEKFLQQLIGWGIEGLEVFSSSNAEDDVEFLVGLAAKYKLLPTAGSDFHESIVDSFQSRHAASVGGYNTYGFSTGDIVFNLEEAIARRKDFPGI